MVAKPNSTLFYAPDNSTYVVATDGNGFLVNLIVIVGGSHPTYYIYGF